jgi:hypothetical protein
MRKDHANAVSLGSKTQKTAQLFGFSGIKTVPFAVRVRGNSSLKCKD